MFMIVDIAVTAMLLENSVAAWSLGELCWKIWATPLRGEPQSLFKGGKTIRRQSDNHVFIMAVT